MHYQTCKMFRKLFEDHFLFGFRFRDESEMEVYHLEKWRNPQKKCFWTTMLDFGLVWMSFFVVFCLDSCDRMASHALSRQLASWSPTRQLVANSPVGFIVTSRTSKKIPYTSGYLDISRQPLRNEYPPWSTNSKLAPETRTSQKGNSSEPTINFQVRKG